MERNKILQVLVPAAAAAGVVVLVGVLIALSDWGGGSSGAPPKKGATGDVAMDDSGMTDALPPLDAPEWKPGPGQMRVWDVKEGTGLPCPAGATVTIHYTGWTKDGKVFDSSRRALADKLPPGHPPPSGDPATFPLGNLIRGWQEGIPGMKPGGIRRMYIPYEWAYGAQGRPPSIPPAADLIFEVKLIQYSK